LDGIWCLVSSKAVAQPGLRAQGKGLPAPRFRLINERTNSTVASIVELAVTRADRKRGLLGRPGLDASAAMMLAPCPAVHTAFMQFTIDVVFVDRDGRIRKIVRGLAPWRMSASLGAYAAIEFTSGNERDLVPGDRLYLSGSADGAGVAGLMSLERAVQAGA
jgi:uncharacterized membrane protein (UPF0127 family)